MVGGDYSAGEQELNRYWQDIHGFVGVWSGQIKKAEIFLLPFSLFSVKVCIFAKINNKK